MRRAINALTIAAFMTIAGPTVILWVALKAAGDGWRMFVMDMAIEREAARHIWRHRDHYAAKGWRRVLRRSGPIALECIAALLTIGAVVHEAFRLGMGS